MHNYLEPKELKEVEEENDVGGNNQLQSGTKLSGTTNCMKITKKSQFYNFKYFSEFFALKINIIITFAYTYTTEGFLVTFEEWDNFGIIKHCV